MADATGTPTGTFLKKIRDWKPRCCIKRLTGGSAPGPLHDNNKDERSPTASSTSQANLLLQFGAVQHCNNYPGFVGQHMSWGYDPQQGNAWTPQGNIPTYPCPTGWNQHEEAVRSFAVGSYQGFHGVAVSLKPETFLKLSPEQQMGLINIGKTHDRQVRPPPPPPPKVPHFVQIPPTEHAVTAIEEPEPEPPQPTQEEPAPEPAQPMVVEQPPQCVECNKQITINIMPHQCSTVPLCGPCYHGAIRQFAVYSTSHSC